MRKEILINQNKDVIILETRYSFISSHINNTNIVGTYLLKHIFESIIPIDRKVTYFSCPIAMFPICIKSKKHIDLYRRIFKLNLITDHTSIKLLFNATNTINNMLKSLK